LSGAGATLAHPGRAAALTRADARRAAEPTATWAATVGSVACETKRGTRADAEHHHGECGCQRDPQRPVRAVCISHAATMIPLPVSHL
jgi:hypothetical protein